MQDDVRPTDIAPISKRVIRKIPIRISLMPEIGHARIQSKPGSTPTISMIVPLDAVTKRFQPNERVAYFKGRVNQGPKGSFDALEIEDRLIGQDW